MLLGLSVSTYLPAAKEQPCVAGAAMTAASRQSCRQRFGAAYRGYRRCANAPRSPAPALPTWLQLRFFLS